MESITTDLCELDFPPQSYGQTLEEVETTVQKVIERVFRDEDGIIRSGVYGKTMQSLKLEEVTDRPYGVGCFSENHSIPNQYKPIYNNYENSGQASGKYIRAVLSKYSVTKESQCLELARKTFKALEFLWNNAANWVPDWCFTPELNPYGKGWMPKPFAGIRNIAGMTECSPDQYTDITLGLERFRNEAANDIEKDVIAEMIFSFADWWFKHDYTTNYEGGCSWWKLRPDCIHVVSYFLYLNALADSLEPSNTYQQGYQLWLKMLSNSLDKRKYWGGPNAVGLTIQCMDRLIHLKPDNKEQWLKVIQTCAEHLIQRVSAQNENIPGIKGCFQFKHFGAWYLCDCYRILGDKQYKELAQVFLSEYRNRCDFYHISRGIPVNMLDSVIAGDDYRNVFLAEGHICWLGAYWQFKNFK